MGKRGRVTNADIMNKLQELEGDIIELFITLTDGQRHVLGTIEMLGQIEAEAQHETAGEIERLSKRIDDVLQEGVLQSSATRAVFGTLVQLRERQELMGKMLSMLMLLQMVGGARIPSRSKAEAG